MNTMWLLDVKNGKFHWKHEISDGVWKFISEEDNIKYWENEKKIFEKITVDVYNRAFNESK